MIANAWRRADGRIAPRSGLAVKNFIDTGAGVIDADYRGEVKVLLFNHADIDFRGNLPYLRRVPGGTNALPWHSRRR